MLHIMLIIIRKVKVVAAVKTRRNKMTIQSILTYYKVFYLISQIFLMCIYDSFKNFFRDYIDIPQWLRSLRLHKYTPVFEGMNYKEIIELDDTELEQKGVAALGARRKMLKEFDKVKKAMVT